tara:strand:- start:22 stop:600 length:579 start_codon:yes stop_codon:yes gene_type:complete
MESTGHIPKILASQELVLVVVVHLSLEHRMTTPLRYWSSQVVVVAVPRLAGLIVVVMVETLGPVAREGGAPRRTTRACLVEAVVMEANPNTLVVVLGLQVMVPIRVVVVIRLDPSRTVVGVVKVGAVTAVPNCTVGLVVVVVLAACPRVVVVGIVVVVPVNGAVIWTLEVVVPIIMVPISQIQVIPITVMVR